MYVCAKHNQNLGSGLKSKIPDIEGHSSSYKAGTTTVTTYLILWAIRKFFQQISFISQG